MQAKIYYDGYRENGLVYSGIHIVSGDNKQQIIRNAQKFLSNFLDYDALIENDDFCITLDEPELHFLFD